MASLALLVATADNDLLLLLLATDSTPVIVTFGVPALSPNDATFAITDSKTARAVALPWKSSTVIPENV